MDEMNGGASNLMLVPRGRNNMPALQLDMTEIFYAEGRLRDAATVNARTSPELMACYNSAANLAGKYLGWVHSEQLAAQKEYSLAKATVILEKLPTIMKSSEIEGSNRDIREAVIARDADCSRIQDKLDALAAVIEYLQTKVDSFIRAYGACKALTYVKDQLPVPNFNGTLGMLGDPQANFMGVSQIDTSERKK